MGFTDLLDQFKSARESAVRSAVKKQEKALKSVAALTAFTKRNPSPVKAAKPPPERPSDRNADIIHREATKRDENRDIYLKSKPRSDRSVASHAPVRFSAPANVVPCQQVHVTMHAAIITMRKYHGLHFSGNPRMREATGRQSSRHRRSDVTKAEVTRSGVGGLSRNSCLV